MSYKPRLKKQTPYSLNEYKGGRDYHGNVGEFTIVCGSMDGYSVANSLRRNILTKSVGYAVVSYKIGGSESPFDAVHGFDLTTNVIVDNLSKIQFSLANNGDYDVTSVDFDKFTGDITAGMFASENVIVHNPDLVIFRVSNVPVSIDCGIGIGYGYITEEENRQYFDPLEGWFVKEANFNPVHKVSYTCHEYGDEDDIINMTIHCGFNADPQDIFASAARDLHHIYKIQLIEENSRDDSLQDIKGICASFLDISIDTCGDLTVRSRNALKQGGISDLRRLLAFVPSSLSSEISGIGVKSIQSIGEFLASCANDELIEVLKKGCDKKIVNNLNSYIAKANELRESGINDLNANEDSFEDETNSTENEMSYVSEEDQLVTKKRGK